MLFLIRKNEQLSVKDDNSIERLIFREKISCDETLFKTLYPIRRIGQA